mmetsp:Transcript_88098/g.244539  ORF Transcript_88098/g.244539 Transcript_88098/m.244539 type:complete len:304 (+) Transcript_88098:849-1760(+)
MLRAQGGLARRCGAGERGLRRLTGVASVLDTGLRMGDRGHRGGRWRGGRQVVARRRALPAALPALSEQGLERLEAGGACQAPVPTWVQLQAHVHRPLHCRVARVALRDRAARLAGPSGGARQTWCCRGQAARKATRGVLLVPGEEVLHVLEGRVRGEVVVPFRVLADSDTPHPTNFPMARFAREDLATQLAICSFPLAGARGGDGGGGARRVHRRPDRSARRGTSGVPPVLGEEDLHVFEGRVRGEALVPVGVSSDSDVHRPPHGLLAKFAYVDCAACWAVHSLLPAGARQRAGAWQACGRSS